MSPEPILIEPAIPGAMPRSAPPCGNPISLSCDWLVMGEHIKAEIARLSRNVDGFSGRLDTLQAGFEILIRSEHNHVDDLVRRTVEDMTGQIRELAKACQANADACSANREEIGKLKMIMARSVAFYSAVSAGVISLAVAIATKLLTK